MAAALAAGAIVWASGATAQAAVPVPAGLAPGQIYQLVFVTRNAIEASSPLFSTYDNFVQNEANAAGIGASAGINWKAIVSVLGGQGSQGGAAIDHAKVVAPVYTVTGDLIANGLSDLWDGQIRHRIDRSAAGELVEMPVWTGTSADGDIDTGTGDEDHLLGTSAPYVGLSTAPTLGFPPEPNVPSWIQFSSNTLVSEEKKHLYALSGPLQVPTVPEPASVLGWSAVIGLGLAVTAWRRRRASHSA